LDLLHGRKRNGVLAHVALSYFVHFVYVDWLGEKVFALPTDKRDDQFDFHITRAMKDGSFLFRAGSADFLANVLFILR
jgi:hypothetical protein